LIRLTQQTFRRAREERLAQVAGSLTFTTVLAVVPLLAVTIALLTRFPVLRRLKEALQEHLFRNLLPGDISQPVLKHLGQFAANAGGLTLVGSLFLLGSAVLMLLTVENTLNRMWQVKKARPFLRRVGLYLLVLAVGPLVLGASLWATSYLLATSFSLIGPRSPAVSFLLNLGPVLLGTVALAFLFYFVPNTKVRRRDALTGGLLASIAFDLGKRGFAAWLLKLPTYKTVYGAFATLPLFLGWVYFSWLVTLVAALVAANLGRGGKAPPRRPGEARVRAR
jgi:membrane protein